VEASVRIESIEGSVLELLALGAEVEVLRPPELRAKLSTVANEIAQLYLGERNTDSRLTTPAVPPTVTAVPTRHVRNQASGAATLGGGPSAVNSP
jgi:hypothetical protein